METSSIPARGTGGTQHDFIRRGSTPRANPFTRYTVHIPFIEKWYSAFQILVEKAVSMILTAVNALSFKYE